MLKRMMLGGEQTGSAFREKAVTSKEHMFFSLGSKRFLIQRRKNHVLAFFFLSGSQAVSWLQALDPFSRGLRPTRTLAERVVCD